jgi:chromosome segregation ATPase
LTKKRERNKYYKEQDDKIKKFEVESMYMNILTSIQKNTEVIKNTIKDPKTGLKALNTRVDGLETRFDGLEVKFEKLETKVDNNHRETKLRFRALAKDIPEINLDLDKIDQQFQ